MGLKTAMAVSKQSFVIAGLPVHVYSERHWTESTGPVAVLFFLHGRTGTAKGIEWIVEDTLKRVGERRKEDNHSLDLVVVTFVSSFSCMDRKELTVNFLGSQDQRNHGDRLIDAHANGAWKKGGNERHASVTFLVKLYILSNHFCPQNRHVRYTKCVLLYAFHELCQIKRIHLQLERRKTSRT